MGATHVGRKDLKLEVTNQVPGHGTIIPALHKFLNEDGVTTLYRGKLRKY